MEFDSTGKTIQDGAIPQFPPALGAGFNGQSHATRGLSVSPPKSPSVTPSVPGVITAESASGAAEAGMKRSGGVFGTIDMAGVNEILARENKVRAEMADAQRTDNKPGGGVLVIGDGAVTDQDRVNNERTQRWAIDDMASRIKSAGSRSERASLTQAMTTAMNNNVQQRGQDMNFAATISGQGITARGQDLSHSAALSGQDVTMRGQDIGAGNDGKRLSIEQSRLDNVNERWGIEKGIMQGQAADSEMVRTARSDLVSAINSGDQAKIEAAKAKAVAAGIKFDKPNNEFTAVTDNMGMNITRTNKDTGAVDIIDGKTGKLKASIPSPGQRPAAVPIEAFAAQIRAKNPGQSITDEQIAAAYKNQFGVK